MKEVGAARERVELGVSTLAEETMLHDGGDWETKHAQRVKEHKLRQEGGLIALPAPATPPSQDDSAEAAARAMLTGLAESQTRIALALEHQPAPVVHVDVPQPTVNIDVKPAAVNVDVRPPDIRVEAPVVNVGASKPNRRMKRVPVRDATGLILEVIEQEVQITKVPVRDARGLTTKFIEKEVDDDVTGTE